MGATHVDAGKETETCWNLWSTFEAISRRERSISFEYCYWRWVMDSSFWPWRKTTKHAIKAHFISSPEKNSKPCRLAARIFWLFWYSKRVYMTEVLEAGNTVNSARYIEIINSLRRMVCRVMRSTSRILLLHENARPHTAPATIGSLETLKSQVLSHPPYSPDLAPSNFHLFPHLKRDLKGTHFTFRLWSEASCDVVDQTKNSWILHWRHA